VWPSVATGIIDDGVVVVENGHITQVGSWDDLAGAFSSTDVRVLGDVTLMPGLFDCHVRTRC
jgi:imidazolonepropionase-like amidohydrolase